MKRVIIVLALLLAASAAVFAGAKKEAASGVRHVVVATDSTFPPMEFVDEKTKEVDGFDMDLVKAIAEASGFTVEFKSVAWDGIFAGIEGGKYDLIASSVTITDERKATMDFSDPYINAGQILVVQNATTGVSTLADLVGKAVGAQISTTGAFEVEKVKGITLKSYDSIALAFEDLYNGRLGGVVVDTLTAMDYALKNEKYKGSLKIVGQPFTDENYGFVVKKGNKELLDLINAGLKKVKDSGKYAEIEAKWLR